MDGGGRVMEHAPVSRLGPVWLGGGIRAVEERRARAVKRLFDAFGAVVGLVLAAPVIAAAALAIAVCDGGPVVFRQQRIGLGGRPFTLFKLRTMVPDAEERAPPVPIRTKPADDPRVTGVGWWLRRLSIDELPQLVNVLRGEMSLVGPRPPLPAEAARYEPWEHRRQTVLPGMTGLWQVSGRADLPVERWVPLDLQYVDRWSLWLDLVLLARTVPAVLGGRGAR
jgi:lipopolysaccharide/colanic/teichoic acid biosynthesis glycosyltransferase